MLKKTRKIFGENIDPIRILAYNSTMDIKVKWILRAVLTALCAVTVGFILYNSLQTAQESTEQSTTVVVMVQQAVAVIAPEAPIVTATGEDFDRLHSIVRSLAHFSEYTLLGARGGWCCLSYTLRRKFLVIPALGGAGLAVLDECLQMFTAGRGAQFTDILLDVFGGLCGLAFAVLSVWIVIKIMRRKRYETREFGNSLDKIQ